MTEEDSITKFVNTISFFSVFKDVEKQKLISRADCFEKYNQEEAIFNQGDSGDTLYLTLQGKIGLFRLGTIDAVFFNHKNSLAIIAFHYT